MSELMDEVLEHRYVYLPRGEVEDTLEIGKTLGLAVAHAHRVPLTVLSAQKNGASHHAELAKLTIVTERSGSVSDGGVVLAWCPRHKTMEKLQHLENSVVMVVEWIPGEMAAWAKVNEAYNVVTREVMDAGLGDEARAALDAIMSEGYKGWTDDISDRVVRGYLQDLQMAGAYDRELVLAYARQCKWEPAIQRLEKILDRFEASDIRYATAPRRPEL